MDKILVDLIERECPGFRGRHCVSVKEEDLRAGLAGAAACVYCGQPCSAEDVARGYWLALAKPWAEMAEDVRGGLIGPGAGAASKCTGVVGAIRLVSEAWHEVREGGMTVEAYRRFIVDKIRDAESLMASPGVGDDEGAVRYLKEVRVCWMEAVRELESALGVGGPGGRDRAAGRSESR